MQLATNDLSLDPVDVLARIRGRAVAIGRRAWPQLGTLLHSILPEPLDPMALLPVATGRAAGGEIGALVPVAAIVLLVDASLRIVDDCADRDDPDALYLSTGMGPAMNYALALQAAATRELCQAHLPADRWPPLVDSYFRSFLRVCQGQDGDMRGRASTLAEYRDIVEQKTVAAYEFAALAGAASVSPDATAIALCARCGARLGWMAQILDDVEALWFPVAKEDRQVARMTFPVLLGLTLDHPNARLLAELRQAREGDRVRTCTLLDEMDVRTRLLDLALDHRDEALAALGDPLHPDGRTILALWLDWLLRDARSLHTQAPGGGVSVLH